MRWVVLVLICGAVLACDQQEPQQSAQSEMQGQIDALNYQLSQLKNQVKRDKSDIEDLQNEIHDQKSEIDEIKQRI